VTMQRIVLLGTTGSGKSTLATALAQRFGIPHVELDAWNHGPNWTPVPRDELRGRIAALATLFGRHSLLRWAAVSHRRHSRELPPRLAPPALVGPGVVRLRSRREVAAWRDAVLLPEPAAG
jgi:MoxR-like ATPase